MNNIDSIFRAMALCVLGFAACADDSGNAQSQTTTGVDSVSTTDGSSGAGGGSTQSASTSGTNTTSESASGSTFGSGSESESESDTVGGGLGPVELYRGPVAGGIVPGWDPDDPRPLVMMGRLGNDWVATLARIGDDGALSENAAEEIIVWGFETPPPLLYDGPIGGTLPNWSSDAPTPVVMLGHRESDGAWWSTLSTIAPDGAVGDNASDRLIVWGWPSGTAGDPSVAYDGPLDAGAAVPGWNPDDPRPLVLMGTFTGTGIWQATLARVAADGRLSDNLANEIIVWSWP